MDCPYLIFADDDDDYYYSYYYFHGVRAPMVPMHLGHIDGPFVPHNLITAQYSPVPLPKLQLAPRLKILISSGSKKGTQIYCSFLYKSPGKRIPSRFPNRGYT
jgi:hypothetical protein